MEDFSNPLDLSSDGNDLNEETNGLMKISNMNLLISVLPVIFIAFIAQRLQIKITGAMFTGIIRSFVQLSILGYILMPIFEIGLEYWWVVVLWLTAAATIAAREASARPKYAFKGMFWAVWIITIVVMGTVGMFAFGVVIRPVPVWDPQYVIPMTGMLFGNIINGFSLSINALCTKLVEQKREVELYLCFGASRREATRRLLQQSVHTGVMPTLNSMAIIGLVSIPGMMTGQILGGSAPTDAARYQILIMYLISTCSFCSIIAITLWILHIAFDDADRLIAGRIYKSPGRITLWETLTKICCCSGSEDKSALRTEELTPLIRPVVVVEKPFTGNRIALNVLNHQAGSTTPSLEIVGAARSVPVDDNGRRTIWSGLDIKLFQGDLASVVGPSGAGKSQLLQTVADLVPLDHGDVVLNGVPRSSLSNRSQWRQRVRYVMQYKVEIPGTPSDFVRDVTNFTVNKNSPDAPTYAEMMDVATELAVTWGLPKDIFDQEWAGLSGGEAQRVLLAVSIASRPEIMLFDESTASLDHKGKLLVESVIKTECVRKYGMTCLWVSHDDDQMIRMESSAI